MITSEVLWILDIILGLIITGIGIYLIKDSLSKKLKHYTGFLFVPTGISMLIVGLLIKFGSEKISEKAVEANFLYIVAIFIIFGLSLLLNALSKINYRKKYCTQSVEAICVEIDESISSDINDHIVRTYTPIYEVDLNGIKKKIKINSYEDRYDCPSINSTEVIHLDPDSMEDYYIDSPSDGKLKGEIICGACFFGFSFITFIILTISLIVK